jgi:hypothetical protein
MIAIDAKLAGRRRHTVADRASGCGGELGAALRRPAVIGRLLEREGAAEQRPLVVGVGDELEPYRGALPGEAGAP